MPKIFDAFCRSPTNSHIAGIVFLILAICLLPMAVPSALGQGGPPQDNMVKGERYPDGYAPHLAAESKAPGLASGDVQVAGKSPGKIMPMTGGSE